MTMMMMRRTKRQWARGGVIGDERGQGMTEYILVVALIALTAIGILSVFGQNVRAMFAAAAGVLAGDTAANVSNYGGVAKGTPTTARSLADFGETPRK